jgi:hypothetical protein
MVRTAEQLQADVEQELRWEPSVRSEQIGVSVQDGVVELYGHPGSFYEKWGAERAALRVANVTSISSEIIVDLPASGHGQMKRSRPPRRTNWSGIHLCRQPSS